MSQTSSKFELSEKQKEILKVLLDKPLQQKALAKAINISGAGLFYHLKTLEEIGLLIKKNVTTVGTVSVNEISINPFNIQWTRKLCGVPSATITLITGFGIDGEFGSSSEIPSKSLNLLKDNGINVNKIIAFCTDQSNVENARNLAKIDQLHIHPYLKYRDQNSDVLKNMDQVLTQEQKDATLILDVTPLTKFFTIKLLDYSYKYHIPSFCLGKNENEEEYLTWLNLL